MKRVIFFLSLLIPFITIAQDSLSIRKDAPKLFFDCETCNQQFFRQNLSYINFVRDRHLADIYVLVTFNQSGGGNQIINLYFEGQNQFINQHDTLKVITLANQPQADTRDAMLAKLKLGLLKYLVQTPLINKIDFNVNCENKEQLDANKVKDKWNFWTFNLNANAFGNGNGYQKFLNVNGNVSANRTTEKFKTETGGWYNLNTQEFKIDDTTIVKGKQNNIGAYHLLTKSIGKHLAIGQYASFMQNSTQNLWHSISYYPAIEYNIFPYSEASRRQMRVMYRVGVRNQKYVDTTIFNNTSAWYGLHSIVFQYSQIEKWGNVNIMAGGWHYFNHAQNYSASIYPSINFNPFTGFRVGLWAGFQIQNDQFFIRKSEASAEEILLGNVQLSTNYNYNYGFSVGYTFGSKFNNIVNVRFDLNDNYW